MKLLKRRGFTFPALLLAANLLFFGLTDAAKVSSIMLFAGFCLLIGMLYCLIYYSLGLSRFLGLSFLSKHRRRLSLYGTGVLAIIIALQSSGELGVRDVLVVMPLAVLGYLYSSYSKETQSV